ncbi:hypothetical protein CC78DRAFT_454400 [Lojkania enalia]|uniref:Tail specific protease domain-containing protein n=1 Tax=Lojkania enalia TaxID=147567 RepID=A0A9P4N9A8_9PLEO|nr:hypothetical protein CC78DRAFT_454400 [Didymosphaeria enalia]
MLVGATPVIRTKPQVLHSRQTPTNTTAPCAQISDALFFSNGSSKGSSTVPAQAAFDCLNSIPFNSSSAKALLKTLVPYFYWQSTLKALADPPAEYREKVQPAVDILGGLDQIDADIDAGLFENEYDFGWTLYTLVQSAHDGHFHYEPDVVGDVFSFGRKIPLVSVSEDGTKLPSVFAFHDVLGSQFKNISYTPSPVVKINGQEVTEYLEDLSQYGTLQDRDALYNNLFYNLPAISLGSMGSATGFFTGGGRGRFVYPGPVTTLTFANGSSSTTENYATARINFRGINNGQDIADRYFFYGNIGGQIETAESLSPVAIADTAPGYPVPVVPGPINLINGFYIDAEGYEDVAVLQVPSFVADPSAEVGFQKVTQQFLPKAIADGKKKLIIDVQANGGGTILQGYDMFKQLFPSLEPYGANRFRATEAANLIGQSFSAFGSQFPRTFSRNATVAQVQGSYFDFHTDMDKDGKPFTSWADKFGPVIQRGDEYTQISRWNLSDVYVPYNSGGINITGYGPLSNVTTQPFEAANIVLLTDGYCASTCTIFSELLTKQAGVKTIAMGGRSNRKQIQAIGGVKGTNNYGWSYIANLAQTAIYLAPEDQKQKFNSSILRQDYYDNMPFRRAAIPPGVNVRDGLRQNDTSGIALQFIYEEADCRLYYTPEMTVDATAIWRAAADAQWGDSGKCVGGGGYGSKREANEITTSLRARRIQGVSQAALLKEFEAFEKTFDLETDCSMDADGFMLP